MFKKTEELKFFDTLTNDVDALEVESLELLHPVVVPHLLLLLLPYHYPTPNPTHTPLAAKGMELEVPLPPSAEGREESA